MKRFLLITITFLMFLTLSSCAEHLEGDPIIVKKEVSLITGYCKYTYEGWGRRVYFEDPCDKYNIGDKLIDTTNDDEK